MAMQDVNLEAGFSMRGTESREEDPHVIAGHRLINWAS